MSESYSFETAAQNFSGLGVRAKKPKDCSAKHHKVDMLERELKDAEAEERRAGEDAARAYKECEIWKNDPEKRRRYYELYLAEHQKWVDARAKVIKLTGKLHDAQSAAWACEGQNYAG